MTVKIFTELNEQIISDWKKLWTKSLYANVVNSAEWYIAACNAFAFENKVIIAIYEDNLLFGIVGFVKTTFYGFRVYTAACQEFADSQPFLIENDHKEYINYLIHEAIKLEVYIKSISENVISLIRSNKENVDIFAGEIQSYVSFADGEYGNLSRESKSSVLNRAKKLSEKVYVDIREDNHAENLEVAFNIEGESSKMMLGKGVFHREDVKKFYTYLAQMLPKNLLSAILFFGKNPVAYSIGFFNGKDITSSQKAHLSDYNYYKPGKLIKMHVMDYWRIKHNAEEFGFGPGYDRFKMDFTKRTRSTYNIICSKNILKRKYIFFTYIIQQKMYKFLSKHKKSYSFYKKISALSK